MLAMLAVGSESAAATDQGPALSPANAKCGRAVSAPKHARVTLLNTTISRDSRAQTGANANACPIVQPIGSLCPNNSAHDKLCSIVASARNVGVGNAGFPGPSQNQCGTPTRAISAPRAATRHALYLENFLYFSRCGMTLSMPRRRFLSSS